MLGTLLNHYRITGKLGEGGMGDVYRATDTELGRDVAIKVLHGRFSCDSQSLARFEREARALAALNHANIAVIPRRNRRKFGRPPPLVKSPKPGFPVH